MSTQDHDAARAVARARLGREDQVETHGDVLETEGGCYVAAYLWVNGVELGALNPKPIAPDDGIEGVAV